MRQRCHNPEHAAFANYGGRGIRVCDRWLHSLVAFVQDMGAKPTPLHEIDRIDNDRGYEPGNCRWVTRSENDRNRRSTVWVTFEGQQRRLADLCEQFGVRDDTALFRMRRLGWSAERTFREPVRSMAPNGSVALRPRRRSPCVTR
jgi:hypothetical protein